MLFRVAAGIIVLLIGCTDNVKNDWDGNFKTWQDSLSYSMGSDVGEKLLARRLAVDFNILSQAFQENYNADSSYFIGSDLASIYRRQGVDVDPDVFLRGIEDVLNASTPLLQREEMIAVYRQYEEEFKKRNFEEANKLIEEQRIAGLRFIEEYRKTPGAIELPSGLIYREIVSGYGDVPGPRDNVLVHYTGKLIDGTIFDESKSNLEPIKLNVSSVIPGWKEALQIMKVGSRWELVIPFQLAYGEQGAGPQIGPYSTLIFDVELIGIE
jgi:FKBP-type peptidyl-prolyl cis-trans isomerase FklB